MKVNKKKVDYKKIILTWLKSNYIYLIMIALVGARVVLGYLIGAWYGTDQVCDDLAMFNGLNPERLIHPDELSLIKELSYSLFLGISAITGLPYTVFLSLFWGLTAFVVWLLIGKVTKNKWVRLFAFVYVLFLPTAFENWGGLRIYRNSIFVPCIILTFSLALIALIRLIKKESNKKTIWTAIFAGLSFAFTYYLQEGAGWLKACMLVIVLVGLIVVGYRFFKERIKNKKVVKKLAIGVVICLIPLGTLFVWENVYKGFNHAFFGVYETNTRTNGELAKYVETTYIVESSNRNMIEWSPFDAIQATFEASSTLKAHPQLLEEIRTSDWVEGDISKHPINREFLGWVIRTELKQSGLWTSDGDVAAMFKQVNKELDEAFKNGTLKKAQGRIQLLKSAYPYTLDEIISYNFPKQIWTSLKDAIWLEGYTIGYNYSSNDSSVIRDGKILHMMGDVNVPTGKKREIGKAGATVVVWVYRIVNTGLVLLSIVFIIKQIVRLLKNWKNRKKYIKQNKLVISLALASFMFFGAAIVYSFGISWFFTVEFNRQIFIFYRIGMSGFLALAYMASLVGATQDCKKAL